MVGSGKLLSIRNSGKNLRSRQLVLGIVGIVSSVMDSEERLSCCHLCHSLTVFGNLN